MISRSTTKKNEKKKRSQIRTVLALDVFELFFFILHAAFMLEIELGHKKCGLTFIMSKQMFWLENLLNSLSISQKEWVIN